MPTYEYRGECADCIHEGKILEYKQSISDDPLTNCPECGANVKRIISRNVGISFKGSGFYANDSRKTESTSSKS